MKTEAELRRMLAAYEKHLPELSTRNPYWKSAASAIVTLQWVLGLDSKVPGHEHIVPADVFDEQMAEFARQYAP